VAAGADQIVVNPDVFSGARVNCQWVGESGLNALVAQNFR
jgi:hypothetical protein